MYGDSDVYLYPIEVGRFIKTHTEELQDNIIVIAENIRTGIEIVIQLDDTSVPEIVVLKDGEKVCHEEVSYMSDAGTICRAIYGKYLGNVQQADATFQHEEDEEEDDLEEENEKAIAHEIDVRNEELDNAFWDFLEVVLLEYIDSIDTKTGDDLLEDLLDVISVYEPRIYRPCYGDDEDEEPVFIEYPYLTDSNLVTTPENRVEI